MAESAAAVETCRMPRRTHRPASAAIALIATLLLAAPAMAGKPPDVGGGGGNGSNGAGNGNLGTVKVVDAQSGLETLTDNEPHVCTFVLNFYGAPDGEAGTWTIVDWPPTGDGTQVGDGAYVIPAGGSFLTGSFDLDAGHYRVNWQGINAPNGKHKTFWVDECLVDEPEDEPEDETQEEPEDEPVDEPDDEPEDEPADEPQDEPEDEPEGGVENSVEDPTSPEDDPEEQLVEQPEDQPDGDDPQQPDNDLAPEADDPIVEELPDTAMSLPVLPGLGVAVAILLLIVVHRSLLDRGLRARR
jgi:hypothetical protein